MPSLPFADASPDRIEERSLAIIDAEVGDPKPFAGLEWLVARRLVHTSADFELLSLLRFSPGAAQAGLDALRRGATVVTDTEMARCGIPLRRLNPLGCQVVCLMNDPEVVEQAAREGRTRAGLAAQKAAGLPGEKIYVVGNAPTALLALIEEIQGGRERPALVVGMPVGFVNAAESKDLLMELKDVPFVSIRGRKGGSALAASVINALAREATGVGHAGW